MTTIRKQSIYSSIFIYIGFAIGAFNVLYLFPKYFTKEEFGLTRILVDIALILSTLCTAAAVPVGLKFNPYYKSHQPGKKNDLKKGPSRDVFLEWVFLVKKPTLKKKHALANVQPQKSPPNGFA